ncbi:hypothetical protein AVEN_1809-1 [Araneus ventricosus]|uniref:Uncharacterized protein n=1 Tax=Araneus ventricosus TaxID=182803 RepID=A0A4Y2HXB9_ARAVE|nr:hypothetical protein AVEN_1809-1 [Araneus ventricosus]
MLLPDVCHCVFFPILKIAEHHEKVVHLEGRDVPSVIVIETPEGMQKEEYEEWMSIDEDITVAATLTDLEICQARPSHKS